MWGFLGGMRGSPADDSNLRMKWDVAMAEVWTSQWQT